MQKNVVMQRLSFSHHYQGRMFNTFNTNWHGGRYFLMHPWGWINGERMSVKLWRYCIRAPPKQDFPEGASFHFLNEIDTLAEGR